MGLYNSTMAISGVYRWLKCKGIIFQYQVDILMSNRFVLFERLKGSQGRGNTEERGMRPLQVIPWSPFKRNLQVKRNFLRRELDLTRRAADALCDNHA